MSVTDRIRELAKRASRPPWWVNDGHYIAFFGNDGDDSKHHVGTPNAMAAEASTDAELTALLGTHAETLCDLVDQARRYIDSADECRYDHHGYCQEHWIAEGSCPVAEFRAALKGSRDEDDDDG